MPTARPAAAKRPGAATIPCVDPSTGESLGDVPVTAAADVAAAVARARDAQRAWARTSFDERRAVLRHVQRELLDDADELCDVIVRDAGKTRENAMMGEIWPVSEKLRWLLSSGEKHLRDERVSSGLFAHKRARIQYAPLGVVGVVSPWNYPLQNLLAPALPALFAGNAVVLKPSEHVAWSAPRVVGILREALAANGHSPALVQLVQGFAETGAALVGAGVDLLIFTGSMANGRRVIAGSAETLTPVILELGGKDAMIVCDDADLEQAAHAALNGSYIAAGQNCLAAERTLVHAGIHDAFVERVVELAGALRQGAPLGKARVDVGAMVTEAQAAIVERLVDDAVASGARAVVGGSRPDRAGSWFEPTVLVDVRPEMAIMREETFGPVMCICRVESDAEAIRIANDTQYGLSATVLSGSRARARRIADAVVSGSVSINDYGLTYMAQDLPFGGVRGSGFGRLNGRDGLRAMTNARAVLEDGLVARFMAAPAALYPVGEHDYATVRGALRALYGVGVSGRIAGVRDLAGALRDRLNRAR